MECIHIKENHGLPRHILPCRDAFCLDCTRKIPGLMEDKLFACPSCGNYSQYVDARQTVEGRSGTVHQNSSTTEEQVERGGVDPSSQSHEERGGVGEHQQLGQYNQGASAAWTPSHDSGSHEKPMDTSDADEGFQPRDLDGATGVNDTTRKDQDIRLQQIRENTEQNHRQNRFEASAGSSKSGPSNAGTGDQLASEVKDGYCKYHPKYKLEYSCSCQEVVCLQCTWGSHRVHEHYLLGDGKGSGEAHGLLEYNERQQQERLVKCNNEKTFTGDHEGGHHSDSSLNTNDIFCKSHPNSEVFFFCKVCDIPVCTHCTTKEHKNHHTVQLQEGPTVDRQCQLHGLPIMVYCKKCMEEICIECKNRYHLSSTFHHVIPIAQAKNDLALLFSELSTETQYAKGKFDGEIKSTERKVEDILREAKNLKEKVDRETKDAIKKLNVNAEAMFATIDRHTEECLDVCAKHTSQLMDKEMHRLDVSEREITDGKQLLESNEVAKAKNCANRVETELTYIRRHKATPPMMKTDLQCRTSVIPGSTSNKAPVHLTESRIYAGVTYPWK